MIWLWVWLNAASAAGPCEVVSLASAVEAGVFGAQDFDASKVRAEIAKIESRVDCLPLLDKQGLVRAYQWAATAAIAQATTPNMADAKRTELRDDARRWMEQAARFDADATLPSAAGTEAASAWADAQRTIGQSATGTVIAGSRLSVDGALVRPGTKVVLPVGWHAVQITTSRGASVARVDVTSGVTRRVRAGGAGLRTGLAIGGGVLTLGGAGLAIARFVLDADKPAEGAPNAAAYEATANAVGAAGIAMIAVGTGMSLGAALAPDGAKVVISKPL